MKEATGELNMTIIVSISIGILAAFFFGFLWPMINGNFQKNSQCSKAICDCSTEVRNTIENETGQKKFVYAEIVQQMKTLFIAHSKVRRKL